MRSPTAHILETALALQRAPGERFRLRERPLPDGIVHVLEIASGSPQALANAAAETGHDEQELLEAVRFYLEQVLFAAEDADAYRVLGLAHDAPQDTIRVHHRWLQRWLHPDRAQAGDATVFATRVNQAWAQLRTPELRHDYDVRLAEARLAGGAAPLPADTVHRWEQIDMPVTSHGGRSRWLLAAALVACAVLAVLIFRHQETMAPWEQGEGGAVAATNAGPEMEDRDVGVLAAELMRPVEEAKAEAGTGNGEQGMEVVPLVAAVVPEVAVPPEAKTVPVQAPAPAAPAPAPAPRKLQAGTVISSVSTVAAKPAPVGAAEAAKEPTREVAKEVAKEAPKEATKAEAKLVAASAAPTGIAAAAVDPKVMVERMRLAEKRIAQVTEYLAARPGAAPMWNDPQTEAAARQARAQIRPRRGAKLELIEPQWRLQKDNASISAGYKVRSDGGAGQGRLDVHLVWREGLWLVRGVELAPAA